MDLIASVLTRCHFDVPCADVVQNIQLSFGAYGVAVEMVMDRLEEERGFVLTVSGIHIAVTYSAFPLRSEEFMPADAAVCDEHGPLIDHCAHAAIGAIGDHQGHKDTFRASLAVLQVASVLSESSGVSAVLWKPAQTLTASATFREVILSATSSADYIPLSVLARYMAYREIVEGRELIGIAGLGFYRFIGRDIEFIPKPISLEIMTYTYIDIASWLMHNGLVFNNGDTCGVSETQITRVRYEDKGRIIDGPILSFDIENLDVVRH